MIPFDPLAGLLLDRVRSRFGRRRVLILICSPISSICFALLFYSPFGWSPGVLIIYLWIVQVVYLVSSRLTTLSYYSLAPELSPINVERTYLVIMSQIFGIVGTLLGSGVTPIAVNGFGGGAMGLYDHGLPFRSSHVSMFSHRVLFSFNGTTCTSEIFFHQEGNLPHCKAQTVLVPARDQLCVEHGSGCHQQSPGLLLDLCS